MVRSQNVRMKPARTLNHVHVLMHAALVFSLVAAGGTSVFAGCEPTRTGGPIQWVVKTPIPLGRGAATGVIIGDDIYVTHGMIPLAGETGINSIYNIPGDSWSSGAAGAFPRSQLAGVCIEDAGGQGLVFTAGGSASGSPVSTVEIYNPVTNSWGSGASLPTARRGVGATFVPGVGPAGGLLGTVFVLGGSTGASSHAGAPLAVNEAYDVEHDTWFTLAPMPTSMMDIYSTTYFPDTGMIYVIGGYDGSSVSPLVQIYDPDADLWGPGAPMPTARSNLISGVCGARIFAIGGLDPSLVPLQINQSYDPFADTWSIVPGLAPSKPTPGFEMATQTISTGTEIFAIGSGNLSASNEVFTCGAIPFCTAVECNDGWICNGAETCDVITGTCQSGAPLPDADGDAVCDLVDNCPADANPGQEDGDGDGVGSVCDNCPDDPNPGQADSDSDGPGDVCDCAPLDPSLQRPPVEITGVFAIPSPGGGIVVSWDSQDATAGIGTDYDVARGLLSLLISGGYPGGATCAANDAADTPYTELAGDCPAGVGDGCWYLVRGQSACGTVTYGTGTAGDTLDPGPCP